MRSLRSARSPVTSLRVLVGSGDRIGLFTLPFLAVGLILNVAFPGFFAIVSAVVLLTGVAVWAWCIALILTRVPRGELITTGPYTVVRHPLYTAVALLVLPFAGFLFNTWLGAVVGIIMYAGSRMFAPAEEAALAKTFGDAWTEYCDSVKIPWL
jgi:protein-S-isoprenylcysteine O-methyltransferase Ste14